MRLIDADRMLEDIELLARHEDTFRQSVILGVAQTIRNFPTVDAVEVVRCENCERSKLDGFYCCGADMMPPHKTFPHCFCSYGERKEE